MAHYLMYVPVGITMRSVLPVLLCLLWSLVEIQSQTEYPYISFMGKNLPNHSYVDLSQVREDDEGKSTDVVQCHTDLETCCRVEQGIHRGDWFAPGSDTHLPYPSQVGSRGFYEDRQPQAVYLYRRITNGPTGIYRCVIATNATHDVSDGSFGETLYVGLYTSGRGK